MLLREHRRLSLRRLRRHSHFLRPSVLLPPSSIIGRHLLTSAKFEYIYLSLKLLVLSNLYLQKNLHNIEHFTQLRLVTIAYLVAPKSVEHVHQQRILFRKRHLTKWDYFINLLALVTRLSVCKLRRGKYGLHKRFLVKFMKKKDYK